MRRISLALLAGLLGCAALAANGAGAADTPDASCAGPKENQTFIIGGARTAQTFTALQSGPLVAATVNILENDGGGPGGDYVVSINTTDSTGTPTDTKLATRIVPDSAVPPGGSIMTVRFANPPMVTQSGRYALVVSRPSANQYGFGIREGDDCVGGALYSDFGGGPFQPFAPPPFEFDMDLVFATFLADEDPPQTKIVKHPPQQGTDNQVSFGFKSTEAGSKFQCKMDAKPFRGCETPKSYGLVNGRHIFKVRATDGAGNTDPTPAVYGFKILRG